MKHRLDWADLANSDHTSHFTQASSSNICQPPLHNKNWLFWSISFLYYVIWILRKVLANRGKMSKECPEGTLHSLFSQLL